MPLFSTSNKMALNVRHKQTEVVQRMLNLNSPLSATKDPGELYKVLIMDKFGKDVIAPLLRVADLRKLGVTLHLSVEADRQPIPDVPAVYLLQPTLGNIERLVQDAAQGLYEAMHLNFISTLPRDLLENLAAGVVKAGCPERISKIFDQYLAFVALEPTLFSLNQPHAYVELNDPSARDSQIEAALSTIVDGLFSVCVTLGIVPIIRCPRGGAAEAVASALDTKLRDSIKARNNLLSEGTLGLAGALSRPLLCLFDRNFDLAAAVQHTWTYKPLVQEVLGLKLNKVTIAGEAGPGPSSASSVTLSRLSAAASTRKTYDVDDKDFFWEANGSSQFPKVAEEVEVQLSKYRAAVDEINKKTSTGAQEGTYDPDDAFRKNTQNLISAVSSLPELQEKKKVLDKHTNIATALLAAIKARALDQYYHLEEDLLLGKTDLNTVLKLVTGSKGKPDDKLRLVLIYLLAYDGLPNESEISELESALRSQGADVTPLAYVRTLKRNHLTGSSKGEVASQSMASQSNLLDWANNTFAQGISQVTKNVKTLLAGQRQPPIVTTVDNISEGKAGTEFDSYAVFDPKAPAGRAGLDRAKGPFKEVIVFMIGGGNYLERELLLTWGQKQQPAKHILYGATDVLSGDEFVQQLAELGRRSGVN